MQNGNYAFYHNNTAHGDDTLLTRELSSNSVIDAVLDGVTIGRGSVASALVRDYLSNRRIISVGDVGRILKIANNHLGGKKRWEAATTATIALKRNQQLYIVNIGDSPAYLVRGEEITELTTLDRDKSWPANIEKAIGMGTGFRYHTNRIELQPGDKIILLTDGIFDNIYPEEIAGVVNENKTPQEAVRALELLLTEKESSNQGRRDVFGRFKPDDATAIIRYLI